MNNDEWEDALLRVVQANPGFDWRDYDDGITADQAAQFLIDDLAEAWRLVQGAEAKLAEERAHGLQALRLAHEMQDKAVAAERERLLARIKHDEFHFDAGCQSILARLENPDEALVEAVQPWLPGYTRADLADITRALARTLTEGKEDSDAE